MEYRSRLRRFQITTLDSTRRADMRDVRRLQFGTTETLGDPLGNGSGVSAFSVSCFRILLSKQRMLGIGEYGGIRPVSWMSMRTHLNVCWRQDSTSPARPIGPSSLRSWVARQQLRAA